MVITSHYKVLTEVKKLNKEEEAKELARAVSYTHLTLPTTPYV